MDIKILYLDEILYLGSHSVDIQYTGGIMKDIWHLYGLHHFRSSGGIVSHFRVGVLKRVLDILRVNNLRWTWVVK